MFATITTAQFFAFPIIIGALVMLVGADFIHVGRRRK